MRKREKPWTPHADFLGADEEKAYAYAIRLLRLRLRGRDELAFRLRQKRFSQLAISRVLARLASAHLLDDTRFVEACVASWKDVRAWGYWKIRARLLSLKIPRSFVEQLLPRLFSTEDETAIAQRLVGKYAEKKTQDQLFALLMRRGFRKEVVARVLRASDED
jgi:SOS response regulatory protein OraA/RecX